MEQEKVCTKCGISKPLSAFNKHKKNKDGLRTHCKTCRVEYYQQNKERIAERKTEYRQQNKERFAERTARRRRDLRKQNIAKTYAKENAKIYKWSADCAELTGVEFHVDHVCPVKARVYDPQFDAYLPATGLHVPWNLDPKPASHNLRKNNSTTLAEILHTPKFSPR